MSIDYAAWFASAKDELAQIQEHRTELQRQAAEDDKKIAALTKTLQALAPLAGEETPVSAENSASGITDRIRSILRQSGDPLTPSQIRDLLEEAGCDMKSYSNPLSTIHTVLRRLVDGLEIKELPLTLDGRKFKCFVGIPAARGSKDENGRARVVGFHLGMKKEKSQ